MTMLRNIFIGLIFLVCSSFAKYTYDIKYFNVPLDHFSITDNRTFPLRYLINDTFWSPNYGPIFFYTGNEGDVEVFAQNTGFLWESAQKFEALIVFAEHRYYGVSSPNISKADADYFSYLSSQQALADYVDLIYLLKNHKKSGRHHERHSSKRSNPVIAFGGSYGGMLSAWMRMKYPAVIEGALAASAPILQFTGMTPCDAYNKALTYAYNKTSPQCVENIRKSWPVLRKTLSQENGKQWVNKNWKLCEPIEDNDDVNELFDTLSGAYSALAMVNYPYPTDFLTPLPANPVKETCKPLSTALSDGELLSAIYEAISVYFNYTGKLDCFDWSTDPFGDIGAQNWNIQACSEIIMPMCSNGVSDMFEVQDWNFTQYSKDCFNKYKVISNERSVEKEYGGKDLRYVSNIIFSNGLMDPWSAGGVNDDTASHNIVVVLPDTAHHLDLRAENSADPVSVVRARKLYVNIFRRWIRNYRKKKNTMDDENDKYLNSLYNKVIMF